MSDCTAHRGAGGGVAGIHVLDDLGWGAGVVVDSDIVNFSLHAIGALSDGQIFIVVVVIIMNRIITYLVRITPAGLILFIRLLMIFSLFTIEILQALYLPSLKKDFAFSSWFSAIARRALLF